MIEVRKIFFPLLCPEGSIRVSVDSEKEQGLPYSTCAYSILSQGAFSKVFGLIFD